MSSDGKSSDVHKDDEIYRYLGEPIAPAINIVHALLINTKEGNHIFYGNGIQIENIEREYERLKYVMGEYKLKDKKIKKTFGNLPHIAIPKIGKCSDKKEILEIEEKTTDIELITLRDRYSSGEITEDEYRQSVDKILEKL